MKRIGEAVVDHTAACSLPLPEVRTSHRLLHNTHTVQGGCVRGTCSGVLNQVAQLLASELRKRCPCGL